jgi:polyphosphate kinase
VIRSSSVTPPVEPAAGTTPAPETTPIVRLSDPALYINRELSWLKFNRRVLMQARDLTHPLLERVKFLAITANNLDEFYMVRLAGLLRQQRAGVDRLSPDGLDIDDQVRAVRSGAEQMLHDIAECWAAELRPELAEHGIRFLDPDDYTPDITAYLQQHFNAMVCPVLTPLAFDPGHPFPHMSNRSKNLAVVVRHRGDTKFARVKVPNTLRRFIEIPRNLAGRGVTFAFLEDAIAANLDELFPGVEILSAHLFRIIRDTDILLREEDTDDLLESVGRELRRVRHGALALLHVEQSMPQRVLDILIENFETEPEVVVRSSARLDLSDLMRVAKLHRSVLKDPPLRQRTLWQESTPDEVFDQLKYQDVLIHHPYDSFNTFENFLRSAVRDPKVLAIKMTLYRVGATPPVVDLLLEAADAGKQVAVAVELKARFDERRNIEWATRLEEAGVHVVYGVPHLKTHCKICLIVRKGSNEIERYAHLATGNYNAVTANLYTDLGLFTSEPRLMADLSELLNVLTGYSNQVSYRQLGVAPVNLRRRLRKLIAREATHAAAGHPARIIIKVNALTDPGMIRDLYRASRAGVEIDLIVRGICCLRPGVPGISDTVRVRSIVDRFLEHSRVFFFENGGDPEVYLGSADLMDRNLNRRVEIVWPVRDPQLFHYLRHIVLAAYLRDTHRATILRTDGEYEPVRPDPDRAPFNAQRYLLRHLPPHGSASPYVSEISVPTTDRANPRTANAGDDRKEPADGDEEAASDEAPEKRPTEPAPIRRKDPPSRAKRGPVVVE